MKIAKDESGSIRPHRRSSLLAALFLLLALVLPLLCHASPSIIDLSYTMDKNTPTHPGLTKFDLRVVKRGLNKFSNWVEINDFFTSEHTGTHLDAPVHFSKGGQTVDQIPPSKIYRVPGVKIDVRRQIQNNVNYEIKPEDIEDWIASNGELPDGCVILFETGWGDRAFDIGAYSGMDQFGKLNFPGIGIEAAEWIVRYGNSSNMPQGIVGVGLDVISLDVGQTIRYPAHIILLGAGLYGLENVANLPLLPPRGFTLTILPVKVGRGSGGPARIMAELDGVPYTAALTAGSSPSVSPQGLKSLLPGVALILTSVVYFRG